MLVFQIIQLSPVLVTTIPIFDNEVNKIFYSITYEKTGCPLMDIFRLEAGLIVNKWT